VGRRIFTGRRRPYEDSMTSLVMSAKLSHLSNCKQRHDDAMNDTTWTLESWKPSPRTLVRATNEI